MKKKKKPNAGTSVFIPIGLAGLLILELFLFTWSRVQYVNTGYQLSQEKKRFSELAERQESLKIELAHLKSPEMIEHFARKKLELVSPGSDRIITVKKR